MRRCLICTAPFRKRPRTTGLLCKACGDMKFDWDAPPKPVNHELEAELFKMWCEAGFSPVILPDGRCEYTIWDSDRARRFLEADNDMMSTEFNLFIATIVNATNGIRFSRASEKQLQDRLEHVFLRWGMDFEREKSLSKKDRPDFLFSNGVALECKVDGGLQSHLRQMKRYAGHDAVTGVLLVSMRPYQMPETLNGKPVACLNFAGKCL